MQSIRIEGGSALSGFVYIQGSKNAALPVMAAALLHQGITTLYNCPKITDVLCMEAILKELGAVTAWDGNTLMLDCTNIDKTYVPSEYANRMRSSIVLMGSMLGRTGCIKISYPGGCTIGKRPIDLHLKLLQEMGARIEENEGILHAVCAKIHPVDMTFSKSSVGATENAILAAVLADGVSVFRNCAREPEILHLCNFLNAMGADIRGGGTDMLTVSGGKQLHDVNYRIPPDRIAAGTYLFAGAATRGEVTLENAPIRELSSILSVYEKMGGQYHLNSGKLVTDSRQIRFPVPFIETAGYPGFPTDMQSLLMSVLATIPGNSLIREQIFEERFKIVTLLNRMGAHILIDGRDALIFGGRKLYGQHVFAEELRGGAALVLAGLSASGVTVIENPHFIERGYENLCENLAALGGKIELTGE